MLSTLLVSANTNTEQDFSVLAVSVWGVSVTALFGLGRFGLETFRSEYEVLQISYMLTF